MTTTDLVCCLAGHPDTEHRVTVSATGRRYPWCKACRNDRRRARYHRRVLARRNECNHRSDQPYFDEVVFERILHGQPIVVPSVDKPELARRLHDHGWTRTRIAYALAMSGARVNMAIGVRACDLARAA